MVAVVPLLLVVFGAVSVLAPEWVAVVHRHQKAAGTTTDPGEITVSATWYQATRIAGVVVLAVGVVLALDVI